MPKKIKATIPVAQPEIVPSKYSGPINEKLKLYVAKDIDLKTLKTFAFTAFRNVENTTLAHFQLQDVCWAIEDLESGYSDLKEFNTYMKKLASIY